MAETHSPYWQDLQRVATELLAQFRDRFAQSGARFFDVRPEYIRNEVPQNPYYTEELTLDAVWEAYTDIEEFPVATQKSGAWELVASIDDVEKLARAELEQWLSQASSP